MEVEPEQAAGAVGFAPGDRRGVLRNMVHERLAGQCLAQQRGRAIHGRRVLRVDEHYIAGNEAGACVEQLRRLAEVGLQLSLQSRAVEHDALAGRIERRRVTGHDDLRLDWRPQQFSPRNAIRPFMAAKLAK